MLSTKSSPVEAVNHDMKLLLHVCMDFRRACRGHRHNFASPNYRLRSHTEAFKSSIRNRLSRKKYPSRSMALAVEVQAIKWSWNRRITTSQRSTWFCHHPKDLPGEAPVFHPHCSENYGAKGQDKRALSADRSHHEPSSSESAGKCDSPPLQYRQQKHLKKDSLESSTRKINFEISSGETLLA